MPALESRRVRIQPLTVIAASFGASPAKILRTLNVLLSMHRDYHRSLVKSQLSGANNGSSCYGIKRYRHRPAFCIASQLLKAASTA